MLKPLSLSLRNIKVLLKALVCQIIILALVIALGFLLFGNFIEDVMALIDSSNLKDFASQTIMSIVSGTFDSKTFTAELADVIENLQKSILEIDNFWGSVELTYFALIAMLCAYRILVALPDVAAACQLDEYMTSQSTRPFTWFFVKKQGRTWKFVLMQFCLAFPLDVLIATGCIGFYLLFLVAFNWWTIIPVLILLVILYSIRITFTAFCLPAVCCEDEKPSSTAFKNGLSLVISRFWHVFWKNFIIVAVIVTLSTVSLLYVENPYLSVAISTVPNFILFFVIKCVNMIEYFNASERPYFYKAVVVEGTEKYNKKAERLLKRQKRQQAKEYKRVK